MSSPVKVAGVDRDGIPFQSTGILCNISVGGAFAQINRGLCPGVSVEVAIELPLTGDRWMSYPAEVIRAESNESGAGIAIRFTSGWPVFTRGTAG